MLFVGGFRGSFGRRVVIFYGRCGGVGRVGRVVCLTFGLIGGFSVRLRGIYV